ncbi:MAG: beta strand repeat-containing protein, partial [Acidobacteriota bacterium]
AVNGDDITSDGDLTITAAGGNLILPQALNVGGASAQPYNFFADATTTAGNVSSDNDLYVQDVLEVDGSTYLSPAGTADINLVTDSDSTIQITGVQAGTGTQLCLTAGNTLVSCDAASAGLQAAYGIGNSITTTDARDIDFVLANTTTDSNLDIDIVADNTVSISRTNNASTEAPAQLVLLENLDTNLTIADGLLVNIASGGVITDAIDASDADIVNAINVGANTILGTSAVIDFTNFDIDGSGNVTTAGDVAVNGGDLTSSQSTFNLLNSGVTTLNIGGAATNVTLGATSGTTTIRNTSLSLPNATGITAGAAALTINSIAVGGGYGDTGTSLGNDGTIQTNGNLAVDGTSTLTGNVTTSGDLAVNGDDITSDGDLTITASGGNLLLPQALNVGGANAAAYNFFADAISGVNNVASDNDLYIEDILEVDGASYLTPSGTNDINIATDADSTLEISGLQSGAGSILCLNGTTVVTCNAGTISLQIAYDNGNSITTSNNRDLDFVLADTITDSNFDIDLAADNTVSISRVDNASSEAPAQLLLLENLDSDLAVGIGLNFNVAAGGLTTALDVSDADIVNALAAGENNLSGTNWDIAGTTGAITTSGDIAVNGGNLTSSQSSFNLLNSGVTTLNLGGAATTLNLGASSGTATINNASLSLPNATAVNATAATAGFNILNVGGSYGSTGASIATNGNIQTNGTLTVDSTSTLTGNVTAVADVAINGGDLTTSQSSFNLLNTIATNINFAGAATALSIGNASGTTTINGGLTIASDKTLTANGPVGFTPNSTNDVTINTDSDSFLTITGLQSGTGTQLCLNANNVVTCNAAASGLQSAYDNGNTIATTSNRNIDFILSDNATDANFSVTTATGATGYSVFQRADGAGTNSPAQLVLIDNLDTNLAQSTGLKIQSAGGGIT